MFVGVKNNQYDLVSKANPSASFIEVSCALNIVTHCDDMAR